jgi:glycoprotein endo-alpha-1,2-mannosidase
MMFVPSIGPGYIDDAIRPWNRANARDRDAGRYYARSWKSALAVDAAIISITSFNEWHEGMQ